MQKPTEKPLKMKRRLSVTNLSSESNLPMFRLNAPVVIGAKVKRFVTFSSFMQKPTEKPLKVYLQAGQPMIVQFYHVHFFPVLKCTVITPQDAT